MILLSVRVDPAILRKLNERRVLNAIRTSAPLSRTAIQNELDLTLPTVSKIVDAYMERGWITESGTADSGLGRPPKLVELNPSLVVAIGVELGRRFVRVALVNLLGEIVSSIERPSQEVSTNEQLAEMISQHLATVDELEKDIVGIGIGVPWPSVDIHNPGLPFHGKFVENISHWKTSGVEDALAQRFALPVLAENDANAAALGEMWFGTASAVRDLIFVMADIGVGAGIAVNGFIVAGATGSAGEFSRTIVDIHAEPCTCGCGLRGCVDMVGNEVAILSAIREARGLSPVAVTLSSAEEMDVNLVDVIRRAKAGLQPELGVISRALDYLAVGISNLACTVDPKAIVLGGSTFLADPYVVDEMVKRLGQLFWTSELQVSPTQFGKWAVTVGAATLVLRGVYDHTALMASPL